MTTGSSALCSGTGTTAAATPPDDRWGVWLESVERSLGPHLTGLLFPGVLAAPGLGSTGWSVDTDVDDTELADGKSDDAVEDLTETASAGSVRTAPDIPTSQRTQYRSWARRWTRAATAAPRPPLELRMLVTRTYLVLLAAAVWGTDETWRFRPRRHDARPSAGCGRARGCTWSSSGLRQLADCSLSRSAAAGRQPPRRRRTRHHRQSSLDRRRRTRGLRQPGTRPRIPPRSRQAIRPRAHLDRRTFAADRGDSRVFCLGRTGRIRQ